MLCKLYIDGRPFSFEIEGDLNYGKDEVLIEKRINAIKNTSWSNLGYTCFDLFTSNEFHAISNQLLSILKSILIDLGFDKINQLSEYHQNVTTDEMHQLVIERTRDLTAKDFDIDFESVLNKLEEELGIELQLYNPVYQTEIIILRISRPNSLDINPLHRDGYLEGYGDALNVWIPIAGCNELSSLPVIPESHYWNEAEVLRTDSAKINNRPYRVPGIVKGPKPLDLIRPNPTYGQALLFSPYLVHGAAVNLNENKTRMALELRPYLKSE